ncbi:hypothetical protein MBLNU457_7287t1 [Dothideomycetes sp. NU457]
MTVEAQSLSYITTLASNPPLYPRNPTEPDRHPLTLYIVRVPGSRDVFLTPLKPREKVVNAQDVISSLYFLHVDDPSDESFAADGALESSQILAAQNERKVSSASTISRKPLPTPPASPEDGAFSFVLPPSTNRKHLSVPQRKLVVPPRGLLQPSVHRQTSPSLDGKSDTSQTSNTYSGTVLTLIRRDPSTGAQWNVAKIKDPLVEDISSESLSAQRNRLFRTKVAGTPMYIDIENPGYSKFLNYDQSQLDTDSNSMLTTATLEEADSASRGLFSRRLWMDGSRFADHTYSRRPPVDSFSAGTRSSMHLSSKTVPFVDRRARGYAYKSPWGGKCEFSTGAAGKSLKCRHHVDNTASHNETVADISELRFNLPSKNPSSSIDLGAPTKRSSYYSHKHSKSEPYIETEQPHWTEIKDEDGHIDYSLGRERAGGGFGGKQAKLGKLIVDNEGQKFLDLVVATNLALWWRAYERTS